MIFMWTVKSFVSGYGGLYIFWYYKVSRDMSAFFVMVLVLKKCCAQPALKFHNYYVPALCMCIQAVK